MLNELLKLCDFSSEEIKRQTPRFERAFEICKLTDADLDRGIERLNKYFDLRLKGVRGLLAATFLSFNDHVLAREEGAEKVVYGEWPLPIQIMLAAKIAAPPNVFIGAPTQLINVVLGQIFGRIAPVTEAGERCGQGAGNAHCGLYQTLVGAIEMGILPKPDLLLASGFFCDPPSAALEILRMVHGIPVLYCDGNVDSPWGYWPKSWDRQAKYFGHQIDKMVNDIGRALGYEITEEAKRKSIRSNAALVYSQQRASSLVATADPQPVSHISLSLGGWLYNVPMSTEVQLRAIDAIDTFADEIQERVENGEGIIEKGAPRVYFSIGVTVDPSIVTMVERAGLNVTNTFYTLFPPRVLYRTEYKGFGDKVAQSYQRGGPFCGSYGTIEFIKDYVNMGKLDGMIYCFSYSCKGYTIPAFMIKKDVEKEFGIPVMVLEGDIYDTRNYSAEQMRTRVETFAQMLLDNKQIAS